MKPFKWVIALSLLLILSSGLFASSYDFLEYFYGTLKNERFSLSYFPNVYLGTHRKAIGINGDVTAWLSLGQLPIGIGAKLDVNGTAFLSNFGLPGQSAVLETGGTMMIGWGRPSEFGESRWLHPGPYRHTFTNRYTYYYDTDGTSQPYADFSYELNLSNIYFIFRMGNDGYVDIRDGFRSSAGDISVYVNKIDYLIGFSLGFKLWHGDYSDQCYLTSDRVYDFSNIVGKDYTLGLIYTSFSYNCFRVSVGYDSDKIRVALQNMVHWIQNNGMVPAVDRRDRIFIELSLFGNYGQY